MKAKPDPIFEELWRIKDSLAAEAGYDLHRMCENTRRWAKEHPHTGPRVKDAAELRAWMEKQEQESLVLREESPPYGNPKK
jgi:hypothetical protein